MDEAQLSLDALSDLDIPPTEWEFARATILVGQYANLKIAAAESLTGGLVSTLLTSIPGSSKVFQGGVVAYATDVKNEVLGISQTVLGHGVVTTEVAIEMATNVSKLLKSDIGLGCTGVAGPEAQDGKPVGEVHIAVYDSQTGSSRAQTLRFQGSRDDIRSQTSLALLGLCLDVMVGKTDLARRPEPTKSE